MIILESSGNVLLNGVELFSGTAVGIIICVKLTVGRRSLAISTKYRNWTAMSVETIMLHELHWEAI